MQAEVEGRIPVEEKLVGLGGDPFVAAAVRDMTSSETRGSGGTTRPSTGASFSACVIGASPGRDEEGGDVCLVVWAFVLIALAAVVSLLVTLRGALDLEQWLHDLRVGGAGGLDFPDWVNGPNGSPRTAPTNVQSIRGGKGVKPMRERWQDRTAHLQGTRHANAIPTFASVKTVRATCEEDAKEIMKERFPCDRVSRVEARTGPEER